MPRRPIAAAGEPWPDQPGRRSRLNHPATPHRPRVASRWIASGSPWAFRRSGEPLKRPRGRITSHLFGGGGQGKGATAAPFPIVDELHRRLDLALPLVLDE